MRRDVAAAAVLLAALFALLLVPRLTSHVDVPEGREDVRLVLRYDLDGSATVTVAPGYATRADLERGAPRIAEGLLNATAHETKVRTSGGKPYAVVTAYAAYTRGETVRLSYESARVHEVLAEYGWTRPVVRVLLPVRPWDSSWYGARPRDAKSPRLDWAPGALPDGQLRLHPFVEGGWIGTVVVVAAGAAAFAGITLWPRRRARGRTLCGAGALAGSLVALPFAWPAQDLGAAGVADGFALDLLRVLPLVWVMSLVLGPWLLLVPRRRATMRA